MDFDTKTLDQSEVLDTKTILETIMCTHPLYACVDCPCFKICMMLGDIHDKCEDALDEVIT